MIDRLDDQLAAANPRGKHDDVAWAVLGGVIHQGQHGFSPSSFDESFLMRR